MPQVAHLQTEIFNRPLLIYPPKLTAIFNAVLAPRWGLDSIEVEAGEREAMEAQAARTAERTGNEGASYSQQYRITDGGTAVIPIIGALVHRGANTNAYSGLTGYANIEARLSDALADPSVRAILLDIDSPGGSVAGCFELAQKIHAARQVKPIWAIANEMACSAAYALASACGRVFLPASADVGSIGVVAWHLDQSGSNKDVGVKWTPIYAGARKVDGSPHKPLDDKAKARFQADIDQVYTQFVDWVAAFRGMDPEAIRATEAATYLGQAAVDVGLADGVASFDEVLARLEPGGLTEFRNSGLTASTPNTGGKMPKGEKANKQAEAPAVDAVKAEDSGRVEQPDPAQAANAERSRIKSIMTHEQAARAPKLAEHLAYGTDMTADEAGAVMDAAGRDMEGLAVLSTAVAGPAGAEFKAEMEKYSDPGVGADVDAAAGKTGPSMADLMAEKFKEGK